MIYWPGNFESVNNFPTLPKCHILVCRWKWKWPHIHFYVKNTKRIWDNGIMERSDQDLSSLHLNFVTRIGLHCETLQVSFRTRINVGVEVWGKIYFTKSIFYTYSRRKACFSTAANWPYPNWCWVSLLIPLLHYPSFTTRPAMTNTFFSTRNYDY